MSKIVTRVEAISPETAQKYLASNTQNRPVRETVVSNYANMMRSNQWLVTHQGIAFDEQGVLKDGQHRLLAVIRAGIVVSMMVTRGLPAEMDNGTRVNMMDVIDCGRARTVGDQLSLSHGIQYGNTVAACCASITRVCLGSEGPRSNTPSTLFIYQLYKEQIDAVIRMCINFRMLKNSSIMGALAFCMKTNPHEVTSLIEQVGTGVGLQKGSPALTFRNWIANGGIMRIPASGRARSVTASSVAIGSLYHHVNGNQQEVIRFTNEIAINFFRNKQKNNVEKVIAVIGCNTERVARGKKSLENKAA